ncbi:hypothetical protein IVB25_29535 [Bradyrhizobium sp. 193]|uniref:hypothetical protein n=1 Tax=Bradyrhizobium sp. 193 TaxID=2782661 RepID=UPI001FFAFF55|nr:hypothetical protein [Bradyrhizobium sp. 193]MCK1486720.1 hypothetical protein [Bradyrhizobium sp. 193]
MLQDEQHVDKPSRCPGSIPLIIAIIQNAPVEQRFNRQRLAHVDAMGRWDKQVL